MPPQRHGESETTGGKLLNIGFKAVLDIISLIVQAEFNDDNNSYLGDKLQPAQCLITIGDFSTFVDGVERIESRSLMPARAQPVS